MNPLIAGLINILPGVINTVGSIVKNKKNSKEATGKILPAFAEDKHNIADGLELSSKVVIGYGLGGMIVLYALNQPEINIWVLCIGAAIAITTTIAKVLEK